MSKDSDKKPEYPRFKSRADAPCQCSDPCCSLISEQILSRKPKRNELVRAVFYYDCLLCGPFAIEKLVTPQFIAGQLLRSVLTKPIRMLGAKKNADIRSHG